jgi:hypothetical protein
MAKKTKVVRDKGLQTRIVFLTTVEQAKELQTHVETSGMSLAETLRRALDAYLKARK